VIFRFSFFLSRFFGFFFCCSSSILRSHSCSFNVYFISIILYYPLSSFFSLFAIFIYLFYYCSLSSFLCIYVKKETSSVCVCALMEERVKLYLKKKEEDEEDELILAFFFYSFKTNYLDLICEYLSKRNYCGTHQ